MKKNTYIKILTLTILLSLTLGNRAFAEGETDVIFERTPLWSEANFLPNDSVNRYVIVTNNTDESHRAIARATNVINDDGLGDVILLTIKEGNTVLYYDTFSNFFAEPQIILPDVPSGEQKTFDFIAKFTNSGDEHQSSNMSFTLGVGFEDGELVADTTSFHEDDSTVAVGSQFSGPSQGGGGGGGGGNGLVVGLKNLVVSEEAVVESDPPTEGTVVINWTTNIPATSQVVYGLAFEGPYSLDLSLPNFGYPSATFETDLGKVTAHSVTISGLSAGLYNFRVVSRASPPTVGYEQKFVLAQGGKVRNEPKSENFSVYDAAVANNMKITGASSPSTFAESSNPEELIFATEAGPYGEDAVGGGGNETDTENLAALGALTDNKSVSILWIVLLVVVALIFYAIYRNRVRHNS